MSGGRLLYITALPHKIQLSSFNSCPCSFLRTSNIPSSQNGQFERYIDSPVLVSLEWLIGNGTMFSAIQHFRIANSLEYPLPDFKSMSFSGVMLVFIELLVYLK